MRVGLGTIGIVTVVACVMTSGYARAQETTYARSRLDLPACPRARMMATFRHTPWTTI
jgi:hypothetical protein